MTRPLAILLLLINFSSSYGQLDSNSCRDHLNIYYFHVSAGNLEEAYDDWKVVFQECPSLSKNTFIYGTRIVKHRIKHAESDSAKSFLVDLLMDVYDTRLIYYPAKEAYVRGAKAQDMLRYDHGTDLERYELFSEALILGGKYQSAALYNGLIISSTKLYQQGHFNQGDMLRDYNRVIEGITVNNHHLNKQISQLYPKRVEGTISQKEESELSRLERELARYDKVEVATEKIMGNIATCEWLNEIYNPNTLSKHATDTTWLKRASNLLSKRKFNNQKGQFEDCSSNLIFFEVAQKLYELEPSVEGARAMGLLTYRNGNLNEAINYFQSAANLEIDPKKRAHDYLKIASCYHKQKNMVSAKHNALKAASLKANWGDPFILLAQIYVLAEGECGNNIFEKNAVYWAAIDKLEHAKLVDPQVSNMADNLIVNYKRHLPDYQTSFLLEHYEGDEYTIGCGVDETITVTFKL